MTLSCELIILQPVHIDILQHNENRFPFHTDISRNFRKLDSSCAFFSPPFTTCNYQRASWVEKSVEIFLLGLIKSVRHFEAPRITGKYVPHVVPWEKHKVQQGANLAAWTAILILSLALCSLNKSLNPAFSVLCVWVTMMRIIPQSLAME